MFKANTFYQCAFAVFDCIYTGGNLHYYVHPTYINIKLISFGTILVLISAHKCKMSSLSTSCLCVYGVTSCICVLGVTSCISVLGVTSCICVLRVTSCICVLGVTSCICVLGVTS